jgi:hypothetical protein
VVWCAVVCRAVQLCCADLHHTPKRPRLQAKIDKAIKLGVPRMTEAEFWHAYGANA